ncbi:MAG: hypothetical protein MUP53_09000, partial [Bacteroidales bacterium]|nr:hypothetical protein [Bacteroidales bacterium]
MFQLQKKWFGIKSWQANYSESFTSRKEWEIRPGITIVTEVYTIGGGHYVLNEKQGGAGNITEWYGYGSGHYSSTTTVTLKAMYDGTQISVTEITRSIGSGKIGNRSDEMYGASLEIDALTGAYGTGFEFPDVEKTTLTRRVDGLPTSYEEVSKLPQGLREIFLPLAMKAEDWATFDGDINDTSPLVGGLAGMPLFGDMDEPKEYELPKSGLSLKGKYTGKYMSKTWSLRPGGKGKELILAKCDPDWLPEDKNSVKIAVKGDGWYGEEVKVRFTLFEVTTEPGTCMNSKDENKEPDLDFFHPDNSETKFSIIERTEDGFVAETSKPVKNISINVASRDFGAWGKLKAEAGFEGLWQPVLTEDGKDHIVIPVDEAGGKENQIADKFEKDSGLDAGVNPKLDEEGPEKRGDGLSAYEEYRGFLIGRGDQHHRTSPKEPDLFLNTDSQRLKSHIMRIQDNFPAGIQVHLINDNQYKNRLEINPNKNLHNLVVQHGLLLKEMDLGEGVLGETLGECDSPKSCTYAAIDIDRHYLSPIFKIRHLYNTIVHEIMHGISLDHHGRDHMYISQEAVYYADQRIRDYIYPIALYDGASSGDVSCVMSYGQSIYYQDAPGQIAVDDQHRPIPFIDTMDKIKYSYLCTRKTGTGAGENLQLGPAEKGECIK